MILKEIELKHFRNYEDLNLKLNEKINFFIGNNAQGKTNLLESIYYLIITKSFRTFNDKDLIKDGKRFFYIKGIFKLKSNNITDEIKVLVSDVGKKIIVNNKLKLKISEYISRFSVVIFSPNDLDFIKGQPGLRRRTINVEIGQLDKRYLIKLSKYNKILKNRNEYLKQINFKQYDKRYLSIITDQLINKGLEIYSYRKQFIKQVNIKLQKVYNQFCKNSKIEIKYISSFPINKDITIIKKELINKINNNITKEILLSQTLFGPHRDDFCFYIDNKNIKNYGSQGQQRIVMLCFKIAIFEIISEEKKESPLLLLDDVFSELDNFKKNIILEILNKNNQVIITTTDIDNLDKKIIKDFNIFYIEEGKIYKRSSE